MRRSRFASAIDSGGITDEVSIGDALTFVERLPADLAVPADNMHQTRLGQDAQVTADRRPTDGMVSGNARGQIDDAC